MNEDDTPYGGIESFGAESIGVDGTDSELHLDPGPSAVMIDNTINWTPVLARIPAREEIAIRKNIQTEVGPKVVVIVGKFDYVLNSVAILKDAGIHHLDYDPNTKQMRKLESRPHMQIYEMMVPLVDIIWVKRLKGPKSELGENEEIRKLDL